MEKVISQLEPVWQTPTLTRRVSVGVCGTPLWGHWLSFKTLYPTVLDIDW
jgi:hypothetical protein